MAGACSTVGRGGASSARHNSAVASRRLVAAADLAVTAKLLGGDALLPDGERYVAQGVDAIFDRTHQELGPLRRRDGERRARVTLNDGLFHPATVTFGPSVGDDGRVALAWPGADDCELAAFLRAETGLALRAWARARSRPRGL